MTDKAKYKEDLKKNIAQTVEKSLVGRDKIAVAFSGGVDSTLLAKVCQDLGKEVTLLTIGFPGASDIEWAERVAEELNLPLAVKELSKEDLEQGIKELGSKIDFPGVRDFEIALSLYIVFKFVVEQGFRIVLTATGLDALFCGFDKTRRILQEQGRSELDKLNKTVIDHARATEKTFADLASGLGIEKINPFMDADFVEFVQKIPTELKVIDEHDRVRKHILREVAIELDTPESAAMRPKKAIQYSTRIDRVIKKMAQAAGSDREEYIVSIV
ncbi:MAG: asparagine synthase-related protein [Parcubacteria group bacterium]